MKNESLKRPEVQAFVRFYFDNLDPDRRGGAVHPLPGRGCAEARRSSKPAIGRPPRSAVATQDATLAAPGCGCSGARWGEDVIKGVLALCALVSVVTTVGIVVALLEPSIEFFREVSFVDYFTGTDWAPLFTARSFGVLPLIVGTLSVTFWACLVCMPLGLGAAIYLSEYAAPRTRQVLKPALEVLAGIPTVVFGFFALTFFTPFLQDIGLGVDIFNGSQRGLVMGVMLIPTVASISEDAMAAVPRDLRDGAYALGATRLQVSTRIVVPAAISGIIASYRARHLARDRRDDDRADRRGHDCRSSPSTRARRSRR